MWAKAVLLLCGILFVTSGAEAQESPQCPPWSGKLDAAEGRCCGTETPCSHYGVLPTWCPAGFSRAYTAACASECQCTTADEECGMCCKAVAGKCEAKMPLACPTSGPGVEQYCKEPRNFQPLKVVGRPNLCAGLTNPATGTGNLALVPCTDAAKVLKVFLTRNKSGAPGMMFVGDNVNGNAACNIIGVAPGTTLKAGTQVTMVASSSEDDTQWVSWSQTGESGTRGVRANTDVEMSNPAAECHDIWSITSNDYPAKCGGLCLTANLKTNTVVLGDCATAATAESLLVADLQSFATGFARFAVQGRIFCFV